MALHVGINAVFLQPSFGGMERYARALPGELLLARPDVRLTVFVRSAGRELLAAEPWASEVELVSHPLLGVPGLRALSELTLVGALAGRRGCDLVHSLAMIGPLRLRCAHVVTLPDVTWIVAPDVNDWMTARVWRTVVPPVARRADRVIAISRAAADDVVSHLGVLRERIDVVLLGAPAGSKAEPTPEAQLRAALDLGERPVIVSVSAKRAHKNLARLVEAVARLPGVALVLPGAPTPHESELRSLAGRLGVGDRVRFPPYVSDEELEGLYQLAGCVAFPSLNEGFGLPVLEGMRRGVPVACARASALPEVGGDTVAYFDPLSVEDMAQALAAVLAGGPEVRARAEEARERAAGFTWRRTAEGTLASYERALGTASR